MASGSRLEVADDGLLTNRMIPWWETVFEWRLNVGLTAEELRKLR